MDYTLVQRTARAAQYTAAHSISRIELLQTSSCFWILVRRLLHPCSEKECSTKKTAVDRKVNAGIWGWGIYEISARMAMEKKNIEEQDVDEKVPVRVQDGL